MIAGPHARAGRRPRHLHNLGRLSMAGVRPARWQVEWAVDSRLRGNDGGVAQGSPPYQARGMLFAGMTDRLRNGFRAP